MQVNILEILGETQNDLSAISLVILRLSEAENWESPEMMSCAKNSDWNTKRTPGGHRHPCLSYFVLSLSWVRLMLSLFCPWVIRVTHSCSLNCAKCMWLHLFDLISLGDPWWPLTQLTLEPHSDHSWQSDTCSPVCHVIVTSALK